MQYLRLFVFENHFSITKMTIKIWQHKHPDKRWRHCCSESIVLIFKGIGLERSWDDQCTSFGIGDSQCIWHTKEPQFVKSYDIIHWSCVSIQTVSTWFKWQCFSTTWTFCSFCATTITGALPKIGTWNICPASKLQLLHESLSISLSVSERIKLHEFPYGLLDLKQLRILDFSQNNLTTVP